MHDWLQRQRARAEQPPALPREPLHVGGHASAVGSIEPALARRLVDAGLGLVAGRGGWCVSGGPPDAALARIAAWLHAQGLASAWRDELLAVTDVAGAAVAAIERAAVRPLGIATHAVHLVVHDARGQVWVQQRALNKSTDPGRWDTTMGGLVSAGESIAQTLARETWEEAGLQLDDLQSVANFGRVTVRRPLAEGYMVEHIDLFEARIAEGASPANQDGEVERFECLSRTALVERLRQDAFTLEAGLILATWLERRPTR